MSFGAGTGVASADVVRKGEGREGEESLEGKVVGGERGGLGWGGVLGLSRLGVGYCSWLVGWLIG